jgi:peptidoglycan/xylan/chitin deacetylase (PgdA/CDA1 family)
MPIASLLSKTVRRQRARQPRPAILMYHRVSRSRHDPWGLAVDPDRFEEQITYLQRHRTIMSMQDLLRHLRRGALPADAVAITFDDGYLDNLINAKPVLLRYAAPATLFVTTGYIDRRAPFWWDELAAMILESTRPFDYELECGGQVLKLRWPKPEQSDVDGGWRAWEMPVTWRQSAFVVIWRKLRDATSDTRDSVMDALRVRLPSHPDPLGLPMTSEEIRELVSGDVFALGAHGVTHAALSSLNRTDCAWELNESRERCRLLGSKPVEGFAYPYGDMSPEVRNDVAASGFCWACSTERGFVDRAETSLYALPRIAVPNAPTSAFVDLVTA